VAKAKGEGDKGLNMMDMVRTAMGDLGADAKPLSLQAHIKQKFGKEMTTQMISNYKFQIRKQGGAKVRTRGGRGAGGGALQIEDFEAVRGLVNRLGAAQVKRLIDVVA
jgi:hypothetical protein